MRCGRSDRVELDAFLLGGAGEETVDAFREHYPHCADCSAAVADWMALDGALRGVMAEAGERVSAHPEPEDLARYAETPARLGEKAALIESHLSGCASCANELRLLQRFDPSIFAAASPAMSSPVRDPSPARAERGGVFDALRAALSDFVESLRGFGSLAPALAMALIVLAGLWWSGALDRFSAGRPERGGPQLVETTPKPGAPIATPDGGAPGSESGIAPPPGSASSESEPLVAERPGPQAEVTELAAKPQAPSPVPASKSSEALRDAARGETRGEPPVELAADGGPSTEKNSSTSGKEIPVAPAPSGGEPKAAANSEEVLLAAVNDLPPPSYATPDGADSMLWMRQFGTVRGNAPGTAHVRVRAPGDHSGLTLSRTPRLWWALDRKTDRPVQITIVEGDAIDPLLRVELPGPHSAGLHAFDLRKQGASLSPDVEYRWYVSIVVDPDRPSHNPVSAGSLRVAGPGDARRQGLGPADSPDRGNRLAALGLWYDAFDYYASLAAAHPEVARFAAYRDRLAEAAHPTP